jgi:hypothetical protein
VESSCELGNEPSGSMKCWELLSGCTSCGLSSGTQLHSHLVKEFMEYTFQFSLSHQYYPLLGLEFSLQWYQTSDHSVTFLIPHFLRFAIPKIFG